ncbi:MAG: hypothetical protein IT371_00760 [Deltaproteobacteria bacterium]|nr:hypothetical protein [Deltaproteobacteria bacterium]
MKRTLILAALAAPLFVETPGRAEDPFEQGQDALAVKASDGSSSLRAKMKLTKMEDDMLLLSVTAIDDAKFPACTFDATVLKEAASKEKHFKLIGRGKAYRFAPVLKLKKKQLDLKDALTQNNLGACYYPPGTKLVVKVSGVDLKTKVFNAAAIYLK